MVIKKFITNNVAISNFYFIIWTDLFNILCESVKSWISFKAMVNHKQKNNQLKALRNKRKQTQHRKQRKKMLSTLKQSLCVCLNLRSEICGVAIASSRISSARSKKTTHFVAEEEETAIAESWIPLALSVCVVALVKRGLNFCWRLQSSLSQVSCHDIKYKYM